MAEPVVVAVLSAEHWSVATFLGYTLAVFGLAIVSHSLLRGKSFLKEYFLGSRGLGVFALAFTYAATSASGGSFTGFPSLIYQHGWVLALWIAGYMLVPPMCMGLLGKRLNQVSRKTGAITLPDVLRDRFNAQWMGVLVALLLTFFLGFNLVAQFKAGGLIVEELFKGIGVFDDFVELFGWLPQLFSFLDEADRPSPAYCVALLAFASGVVVYTAYGGFRAVVWTDVLQGIVMFVGVLILLPLAIGKAGGLEGVTRNLAGEPAPRLATVRLESAHAGVPFETGARFEATGPGRSFEVEIVEDAPASDPLRSVDLVVRLLDPIAAKEWSTSGNVDRLESLPTTGEDRQGDRESFAVDTFALAPQRSYTSVPGPSSRSPHGFLPIGLALSFFIMWPITGAGQPGTLVRLMAFKSSRVFRHAIFAATIYYSLIYLPLVVIFVCARVVLPDLERPDMAMPQMVKAITAPAVAGILLAAPFAAVMSTVDSFLLMISSSLVRDIYQRSINPQASSKRVRRASYLTTVVVGALVTLGALNPPRFLQDLIVFSSEGLACCFLAPMVLSLYWRGATAAGVCGAAVSGFVTVLALYGYNWLSAGTLAPYNLLGVMPVVWGLGVSFLVGLTVSRMSAPTDPRLVRFFFSADPPPRYPGNTS